MSDDIPPVLRDPWHDAINEHLAGLDDAELDELHRRTEGLLDHVDESRRPAVLGTLSQLLGTEQARRADPPEGAPAAAEAHELVRSRNDALVDRGAPPWHVACTCGWGSSALATEAEALEAGARHAAEVDGAWWPGHDG